MTKFETLLRGAAMHPDHGHGSLWFVKVRQAQLSLLSQGIPCTTVQEVRSALAAGHFLAASGRKLHRVVQDVCNGEHPINQVLPTR